MIRSVYQVLTYEAPKNPQDEVNHDSRRQLLT